MCNYLDLDGSIPVNVNYNLAEMTMKLNEALDLDVNVVEWCVGEEGRWWVIDAYRGVPDVTHEALPSRYYT
jgi:hypothetical protein